MNERLSETPSSDELRAYVLENAKMSAVAWCVPNSEFADGKLAPEYLASLRAFPLVGGALFVQRLLDALVEALERLNALSRDDPFWGGRNLRPTLLKLRDHNAEILRKNPDDRVALWAQAALYVLHGSTNFGPKQWRRLHYVGDFDVRWPVLAALATELNADPTAEALAELLDRVEAVPEAREFLATFDACGDAWIVAWRDAVVAALDDLGKGGIR
jgi:hypothetical protein